MVKPDIEEMEARVTELEKEAAKIPVRLFSGGGGGGGAAGDFGEDPVTLAGTTAAEGTSEKAARADHQHGIFDLVADLQSEANGSMCYDTVLNEGYMRTADGIICMTHIKDVVALT